MRFWILAAIALCLAVTGGQAVASSAIREGAMGAFLEQHCVKCHGPEKQKGDLRLDTLAPPPDERERWKEVLEAIGGIL